MIVIGNPYITKCTNGNVRLSADIVVGEREHSTLWVEVAFKYSRYLCLERSDAFVLALLKYAMQYGHDIIAETPMTRRLYEQLTTQFLRPYYKVNKPFDKDKEGGVYHVRVNVPLAPEIEPIEGGHVGTGASCGVDSMHVFATHDDITTACVWNNHWANSKAGGMDKNETFRNLSSRAKRFSDLQGFNLIVADTNFDEGCLKGLHSNYATPYASLFMIYALKKYWKKY